MRRGMLRLRRKNFQIRWVVISAVTVLMMNDFPGIKRTAKNRLRYLPMRMPSVRLFVSAPIISSC